MNHALLGQVAGLLCLLQAAIYIRSIVRGKTKPSRSGYAIWFMVGYVSLASYLAVGATTTQWIPIVLFITTTIIFLLSFKYGLGGLRKLDLLCLGIAFLAILGWKLSQSPSFAVYACLVASLIAYVPILKKAYRFPETENKPAWVIYGMACLSNILALNTWRPEIASPVILPFLFVASIVYCLYRSQFAEWFRMHHFRMHWLGTRAHQNISP